MTSARMVKCLGTQFMWAVVGPYAKHVDSDRNISGLIAISLDLPLSIDAL